MSSSQFAEKAQRQLRRDVEEIDQALEDFFKLRHDATHMQETALASYEVDMKVFEDQEKEYVLEAEVVPVDHHVMRTVNTIRTNSRAGSIIDEFAMFGEDLDHQEDDSNVDERSALEFKPVTKKKPVPSAEEKNLMRDSMFSFLDAAREDEALLEAEVDRLKEVGGKEAEKACEMLYSLQRNNAIKLKEIIDAYQPAPFGRAWGNDADYVHINAALKSAMLDDSVNVKKLIRLQVGGAGKPKGDKSSKKKKKMKGAKRKDAAEQY